MGQSADQFACTQSVPTRSAFMHRKKRLFFRANHFYWIVRRDRAGNVTQVVGIGPVTRVGASMKVEISASAFRRGGYFGISRVSREFQEFKTTQSIFKR